jgi:hypothetical protein
MHDNPPVFPQQPVAKRDRLFLLAHSSKLKGDESSASRLGCGT